VTVAGADGSSAAAFDGNAYRKAVLRSMLDSPPATLDPFTVFALPLDEDDQTVIDHQVSAVVAFWQREQNSARYRALVTRLLDQRAELSAVVRDPAQRAAARASARASRAQDEQARRERIEAMVERLVRAHPAGVPRSRLERLRAVAAREGFAGPELDARLTSLAIVDDIAEPLPETERTHLRETLSAYNQLVASSGDAAARPIRSLFDLLGVEPSTPDETVIARIEVLAARNRQRRHDRLRTVTDELLAQADQHAHGPVRSRYQATMVSEARHRLTPDIESILLVDDRVGAPEFEHLVRQAVALGLDAAAARAAVIATAAELGGAVETGPAVDYVLCPACGTVEAAGTRTRACKRCGTDLYRSCPSCHHEIEASALRCVHCGADLQALAEAERDRRQRFAAATRLSGLNRERALGELLADHPDFDAARRMLVETPPVPPTRPEAEAGPDSIVVRWCPSESPEVDRYRVSRRQSDGRWRLVSTITGLELEDGGARRDEPVRYSIVAIRQGRESVPAELAWEPPPPAGLVRLVAEVDDAEIRLTVTGDDGPGAPPAEVRIARSTSSPPAPGTRLAAGELAALGTILPAPLDALDGGPRWYVPATVEGDRVLVGHALGHPGLAPVTDIEVDGAGDHLLVRWAWPPGCTEAQLSWQGPAGAGQVKVTNMKYEIDGGYRLPAPSPGAYRIAVVPGARLGRELVWAPVSEPVEHQRD
jgi:hypothetical protein